MVRQKLQLVQGGLSVVLAGAVAVEGYVLEGMDVHRMDMGSWFEVVEFVGCVQRSPAI